MKSKQYRLNQVIEMTALDKKTILLYEEEGLISSIREGKEKLYTDDNIETMRVIRRLTVDLGVNLPGVSVILNMREQMLQMQEEFEKMIDEMKERLTRELHGYESRFKRPLIESKTGKPVKIKIED